MNAKTGIAALPDGDYPEARFVPLRAGASWKSWISGDGTVVGWSPDGNEVATVSYSDLGEGLLHVTLANARSGKTLGVFAPTLAYFPQSAVVGFERSGAVLIETSGGSHPVKQAIMRSKPDGTVERTTPLNPFRLGSPTLPASPR